MKFLIRSVVNFTPESGAADYAPGGPTHPAVEAWISDQVTGHHFPHACLTSENAGY